MKSRLKETIKILGNVTKELVNKYYTIRSIEQINNGLYTVNYVADYKLDKVLEHGVANVKELEKIVSKHLFYGYPIKVKENLFGCSAFFTSTKTGKYIVGRNFDYAKSGAVLVYTQPINGYKSYSMVNLEHLGVSEKEGTMPNTLLGKLSILSAPYGCVDGMNEKGLSVSVLELQTQPTNQIIGNPSITTTVAVRMLLDKASTTDEAVSLLKKYDMKSSAGKPYHFFIADSRGKSIVVDWANQQLNIVETNIATNFQLSLGKDFQVGIGQDRYCILKKELEKKHLLSLPIDAMDILKKVKIEWNGEWQTEWSIVYNLSDFSLDVVKSMEFNTVHHLPKK